MREPGSAVDINEIIPPRRGGTKKSPIPALLFAPKAD
jgi:hypothetical protein